MEFIDTHCHINFGQFRDDLSSVITSARKAGVRKFVVPGVDAVTSETAVKLSQKYPGDIIPAVGFHPYEAQRTDPSGAARHLESMLKKCPYAAVGECGLDYHIYKGHEATGKKDAQKFLLETHLRLAIRYGRTATIHCRDAFDDLFDLIDSLPRLPKAVLHCFSGGMRQVRQAEERKLLMGVDGNVTYSKQLAANVRSIPLSNLLLETDSPLLTPVPLRGRRNEPKNLRLVARAVAAIKGVPLPEVAEITGHNSRSMFFAYYG